MVRKSKAKAYSTLATVKQTILEIEELLQLHGASDILKSYDNDREVKSISFRMDTDFGMVSFTLPINESAVYKVLYEEKKAGRLGDKPSYKSLENPDYIKRVAWRQVKEWLDIQLAMVELEQVKLEQIMLPFAHATSDGRTVYELVRDEGLPALTSKEQI